MAVSKFGDLCKFIRPTKCRNYITLLLPLIEEMIKNGSELLQQTLSLSVEKIFDVLIYYLKEVEVQNVINLCIQNFSNVVAGIRRSASDIIVTICNLYPRAVFNYVILQIKLESFLKEEIEVTKLQGVLYNLSKMVKLSDHLSKKKLDPKNPMIEFVPLLLEVILKYIEHPNHNVVNSSLELLTNLLISFGDKSLHRAWFKKQSPIQDDSHQSGEQELNIVPHYDEEIIVDLQIIQLTISKLEALLKDQNSRTGEKNFFF